MMMFLLLWPGLKPLGSFLAFASYMGFIVYQMDVKSAFLYGKIDEEVYVSQPPGFIDLKYPQKVYKVVKALYGLHQASRVWNGYLRKGRKTKPKRQNRTRNGKAWKKTKSSQQKVNPDKPEAKSQEKQV
ncbi:copia protein [Tanacetum coccineum]